MISKGIKSIFPIKNQEIWDRYKLHIQSFWTPEEVSLQDDLRDLQILNEGERHFIKNVLAFFANSEAMINENLASRFYKEILMPEARCFISMQMLNESIHAEMYALQIEAYVVDQQEKDMLFNAIQNVPCINLKAKWVSKWLSGSQNLLTRLIAFGLVEGLFFAGSFCAIYYFRKRGLLPGLALSNDWIARDEGMHFSFSALMFKILRDKFNNNSLTDTDLLDVNLITGNVAQSEFEEIVREAVSFEKEFVQEALPVDLIGMNANLMSQYIEAVADRIADLFEFERVYNTKNPFDFMRALDVQNVTNFFEKRVSEYQRPTDRVLSFDDVF
ncbi:MAG: Ribonucleoside-diphosphate reductase subunit beta [Alphaproteobacteria bacterium MarineAlpha5_Bin2]|jgi:ribonucleotide reductase beta subunit family protein with ferritin-like domain|nr:ribonucleotide-diphosphate reductase subunit beta [Alphaproteobacteria bacterium]PPR53609.1 MAG: Ribonucleoside-diphosphate reductase subunit beta [Alphaproteobacteria bacterium MarineAlpha5_Bin2]PPR56144.1 MAG: Ribonucleoside-diphosphate reductase subunit beta [Alphaproteobacteria bacterium MarineAlpha5_Bin3]